MMATCCVPDSAGQYTPKREPSGASPSTSAVLDERSSRLRPDARPVPHGDSVAAVVPLTSRNLSPAAPALTAPDSDC